MRTVKKSGNFKFKMADLNFKYLASIRHLKFTICHYLFLGLFIALSGSRANALPGQTTKEVTAWISANPTLQPYSGETLLVKRSDSAAQRFTFEASFFSPGRATVFPVGSSSIIRTERFDLFDLINGVTPARLEESLRVIYGLAIYQDYQRARVVYAYPNPETVNLARNRNAPLLAALQGELRLGDRFAYWIEVSQPPQGFPIMGRMTVFLKEDLDKIEAELRNR